VDLVSSPSSNPHTTTFQVYLPQESLPLCAFGHHPPTVKMKFTATAAGALVLANAAIASPLSARSTPRTRRTGMNHRTSPSDWRADQQSSNWGGAVIVDTAVTQVTGTFTVPTPKVPSGGDSSTQYCGAAWVGIDGDTCQSGLIQTGVFWCVQGGQYSYEAWYEYIPEASIAYDNINVSAGDVITVTVTASGTNGGTTTFENTSNGQTASHTFSGQTDGTLCGTNAEWIVEDFEEGSSLVPFADFGTVVFTGSSATVGGNTVSPGSDNAQNIFINQGAGDLTSTTISGDTVTVNYG
jgi:hypothetical protein